MFKHVIAALDGSNCATHAFEVAVRLATAEGATLAICSVVDPVPYYEATPPRPSTQEALDEAVAGAQRIVDNAVACAKAAGIEAAGKVVLGEPAHEIVLYAVDRHGDAIVMGTHGRSGLKRLFMGSVAEAVLRSSSMPVVIVREQAHIPTPTSMAS